jgi:cytochrome c-type biogenesis protein
MDDEQQQSVPGRGEGSRFVLAVIGFFLLLVIVVGLFYLASSTSGTTSLVLAYVAGLSMIFLPCTLPLAFIIVPLTMGQSPRKGLTMALLFGLGVSITLAFYGVLTASIGSFLGVDKATRIMFTVAGTAALLFGLSELKLVRFTMPGFSGATPAWIQRRQDYTKIFFLGLFLGNAGVGCPNPAFYVLLTYIASVGSIVTGGWLAFIHGVGRATPLIFLAILGLLGVNSLHWIVKKKSAVDRVMGWGLLGVGSFIATYGIMGMRWWEEGALHIAWNNLIMRISPNLAEQAGHELLVPRGFVDAPIWAGWVFFLGVIVVSVIWYKMKKKEIFPPSAAEVVFGDDQMDHNTI